MRRIALALALAVSLTPAISFASGWRTLSSQSLGFTVHYPAGWRVTSTSQVGVRQVSIQQQGTSYAVTISILNVRPGRSAADTVRRFLAFERRLGEGMFARVRWEPSLLGGRASMAGVATPPTEGGVGLSLGVYVAGWRSHIYEVTLLDNHQPPLHSLGSFPRVYAQIIGSWRFR
ncbi:MAG TPA: hypothetical protein VKX16_13925 [Chloroflexota bacterium]|nr:hypothetical protein [Chloroflexota bacterium]